MVKKLPLVIALCICCIILSAQYCGNSGSTQCTPAGAYSRPGIYPTSKNLAPFNNNIYVDTVLQFQVPSIWYASGHPLNVSTLRIDSITNLPPGLCWCSDVANNTFNGGSLACLHIKGTPCGATGQYKLAFCLTQNVGFGVAMCGDSTGISYIMRLKNPADTIIPTDTTQPYTHLFISRGGTCAAVLPLTVSLGVDQNLCNGASVSLSPVVAGGIGPYTYSWQHAGNSLNCNNCANVTTTLTQNSTFIVVVTDFVGHVAADTINYNVTLNNNYHLTSIDGICLGDTLILNGPSTPAQIIWQRNGITLDTAVYNFASNLLIGTLPNTQQVATAVYAPKNGNVYVVDPINNQVIKFTGGQNNPYPSIVAGNGMGSALNQMNEPQDVVIDNSGNFYVSDFWNNRVLKFPANSVAGTAGVVFAGGNTISAALNSLRPSGLCLDTAGNLYVADWYNNRVLRFPPNSNGTTNGVIVAGGNGQGSNANQFYAANYVKLDKRGNLYVTDYYNSRVLKFPSGSTQATNGVIVAGGNGAGSALNQVSTPGTLCLDSSLNLYVTDYNNNRVMRFPAGSTQSTYGAVMTVANGASGVAVDSTGNFYVSYDVGAGTSVEEYSAVTNNKLVMDSVGTYSAVVIPETGCMATPDSITTVNTSLNQTLQISVSQNNICLGALVTFTASALVQGPNASYQWYKNGIAVGNGSSTYSTSSIVNSDSVWCVSSVLGGCTSPQRAVSNIIHMVQNIPSVILPTAINNCQGSTLIIRSNTADLGTAPVYTWKKNGSPVGGNSDTLAIASVTDGDSFQLFVHLTPVCGGSTTDTFSNKTIVTVFPVSTVTLGTMNGRCTDTLALTGASASSHIVWQYNGSNVDSAYNHQHSNNLVGGVVAAGGLGQGGNYNQLMNPRHVFIDKNDYLYVTDGFRVIKFPPRSKQGTSGVVKTNTTFVNQLFGGVVDSAGNLYVTCTHFVYKYPPNSDSATNRQEICGISQYNGSTQQWEFFMNNPLDVALDKAGNIYVADQGYNVVWEFAYNSVVGTVGTSVAGGNGPGSAINQFSNLQGVYLDTLGNIYCTDYGNNRIVKYVAGGGPVVVAGNHTANPVPGPLGVGFDTAGALFVGGSFCAVKKFGLNSDSTTVPLAVAGTSGSCGAADSLLNTSYNVAFDSKGNMYVPDYNNYRVLKFYTEIDTLHKATAYGNYQATVTTQEGCKVVSNAYTFSANPITSVSVVLQGSDTICSGDIVSIQATPVNGGSSPKYSWYKNGLSVNDTTRVFSASNINNNDSVWVVMKSSVACAQPDTVVSNKIVFSVLPQTIPQISITPASVTLCAGSAVTFTATYTGGGLNPHYQWQINGVNTGGNADSFNTSGLNNSDTVHCILTSNAVCAVNPAVSNVANVHVNALLSSHAAQNICQGQTFNFNGTLLSNAGTYYDTLISSVTGCDSIITLALTVNSVNTTSVAQFVCSGHSFNFNGTLLNNAGIYHDTLVSSVTGCDSIITLSLTVNPVINTSLNQSVCSGHTYNFNGTSLSTAGIYKDTLSSTVTGCDSIVTLTLAVGNIVTSSISQSICAGGSYNFNGVSIMAAGSYNDTLPSSISGCDSVVTLTLSIIQPVTTAISNTICAGNSFSFNGALLTTAGNYIDTLTSVLTGCDSIITLTLSVTAPVNTAVSETICAGSIYNFNGTVLNTSGIYADTLTSATTGCDSIIALTLSVVAYPVIGLPADTTLCPTSTVILSASATSGTIIWNGGYTNGQNVTVNQTTQFVVTADTAGCITTDSFTATVLPEKVWPGDANEDLVVNNYDILAIGLAYGNTGSLRPNASLTWEEQCAPAWADSFSNGTNYAFADCNGDGVINYTDTDAVSLNYSLVHPRSNNQRAGGLPLIVHTNTGIYQPGDTVTGQILLGTSTAPANSVYGIAYTLDAGAFAKPNTLKLSQANSWLVNTGSGILFGYNQSAGIIEAAQTRINHSNASGYGAIADFSFVVDSGVTNGSIAMVSANTTLCVNKLGDTIGLTETADTITAIVNGITTLTGNSINVYPNPTNGVVIIQVTGAMSKSPLAEVYDQLGQVVLTERLTKNTTVTDLSAFASGFYFIKITDGSSLVTTHKICLTK